jgi:hypothetical protein
VTAEVDLQEEAALEEDRAVDLAGDPEVDFAEGRAVVADSEGDPAVVVASRLPTCCVDSMRTATA